MKLLNKGCLENGDCAAGNDRMCLRLVISPPAEHVANICFTRQYLRAWRYLYCVPRPKGPIEALWRCNQSSIDHHLQSRRIGCDRGSRRRCAIKTIDLI